MTLRKISKKHSIELSDYQELHKKWFEDPLNQCCNLRVANCTFNKQLTVHHIKGRGPYLLDTTTWITLCMNCHRWVHDNHNEAKKLGLL